MLMQAENKETEIYPVTLGKEEKFDPELVWQKFFTKFEIKNEKSPPVEPLSQEVKPFHKENETKITKIQRFWRNRTDTYHKILILSEFPNTTLEPGVLYLTYLKSENSLHISVHSFWKQKKLLTGSQTKELNQLLGEIKSLPYSIVDQERIQTVTEICDYFRHNGRLLAVNTQGHGSPEFKEFINRQRVERSLHHPKLTVLHKALQQGNWNHKIFKDKQLSMIAVSLFFYGKITEQQNATILQLAQLSFEMHDLCLMSSEMAKDNTKIAYKKICIGKSDNSTLQYAVRFDEKTVHRGFISKDQLAELSPLLEKKEFKQAEVDICKGFLPKILQITSEQGHIFLDDGNKDLKIHPIFDKKSQFTEETRQRLIPALSQYKYANLNKQQLEELRLLALKLPKSEQYWYSTNGQKYANAIKNQNHCLGLNLIHLDAIYYFFYQGHPKIAHLTTGFRDAYGIVQFGENYIRATITLGEKTKNDIKEGLKKKTRYSAIQYKGTVSYTNIHGMDAAAHWGTGHDFFHSFSMSTMPVQLQNGLILLADTIVEVVKCDLENKEGETWSKEIWDYIDGEFLLIFEVLKENLYDLEKIRKNKLESSDITKLFCDLLFGSGSGDFRNYVLPKKNESLETFDELSDPNRNVAPIGIIFILDCIKNPEKWKKEKIDLNLLPDHDVYKSFYVKIKELYEKNILSDNKKLAIFQILLFQNLKNKDTSLNPMEILKFISDNKELFSTQIKFKRITAAETKESPSETHKKNTIFMSYNGERIHIAPEKNDHIVGKIITQMKIRGLSAQNLIDIFSLSVTQVNEQEKIPTYNPFRYNLFASAAILEKYQSKIDCCILSLNNAAPYGSYQVFKYIAHFLNAESETSYEIAFKEIFESNLKNLVIDKNFKQDKLTIPEILNILKENDSHLCSTSYGK